MSHRLIIRGSKHFFLSNIAMYRVGLPLSPKGENILTTGRWGGRHLDYRGAASLDNLCGGAHSDNRRDVLVAARVDDTDYVAKPIERHQYHSIECIYTARSNEKRVVERHRKLGGTTSQMKRLANFVKAVTKYRQGFPPNDKTTCTWTWTLKEQTLATNSTPYSPKLRTINHIVSGLLLKRLTFSSETRQPCLSRRESFLLSKLR